MYCTYFRENIHSLVSKNNQFKIMDIMSNIINNWILLFLRWKKLIINTYDMLYLIKVQINLKLWFAKWFKFEIIHILISRIYWSYGTIIFMFNILFFMITHSNIIICKHFPKIALLFVYHTIYYKRRTDVSIESIIYYYNYLHLHYHRLPSPFNALSAWS